MKYMEVYNRFLLPLQEFLYDWRNTLDICVGIALLVLIVLWGRQYQAEQKRKQRKAMGARMTRKERIKFLHSTAGKNFSDWLIDMELKGTFTASDVRYLARRGSYAFDTTDAVVKDRIDFSGLNTEEQELLKSIMRSKAELRKMICDRLKPNIPGPKPGEVDNVTVFEKKKPTFGHQLRKAK